MTTGIADGADDIALAGEYVLGLLPAGERGGFESRLNVEPALRRLVADWSESFATLAAPIAAVAPPPGIKRALDARLFPAPERRRGLSLGRLLGGAVAGLVAVLALVVILPFLSPQPEAGPVYQAQIATEDSSLVVLASLDTGSGVLTVVREAGSPADGRSLELWLIAEGATAPVSLGVIDLAEATVTVPPELRALFQGGTLAISDEPLGGSPTGTPTNVLAAGAVTLV